MRQSPDNRFKPTEAAVLEPGAFFEAALPLSRSAADNPTHRRVVTQPLGVVYVLIASQAEH
jgi:hypothetical protein